MGGRITTVYHNPLGRRALLHPERFDLLPRFARPNHRNDIDYYTNPDHRGYLSDAYRFASEFAPRGYIGLDGAGAEGSYRTVQVRFQIKGLEEVIAKRREERLAQQIASVAPPPKDWRKEADNLVVIQLFKDVTTRPSLPDQNVHGSEKEKKIHQSEQKQEEPFSAQAQAASY